MSCAGCDDCPQDAWHLHVTVDRENSDGSKVEYVSATGFGIDMARLGYKPVSVVNVIDGGAKSYREWIPTKYYVGTEAAATHELFVMGHRLKMLGWIPKRLKIEGDPRKVPDGRALYYESHIKEQINVLPAPLSVSSKISGNVKIYTIRRGSIKDIDKIFEHWRDTLGIGVNQSRIEACVLDTAPELDAEWLRSYERGTIAP